MIRSIDSSSVVEGLFLALSSLWALYVISESLTFDEPLPAILPVASTGLLLVFVAIRGVFMLRGRREYDIAEDDSKTYEKPAQARDVLLCLGLIVGYAVLALQIGFFWAMPVFLLAFFLVYDLYSIPWLVAVTLVLWIAVCILFGVVFNISGVDLGPFTEIDFELF